METRTPIVPNYYALSCEGTSITYLSGDIAGIPRLTYVAGTQTYEFGGKEIRVAESELGQLITVTLKVAPDTEVVTLTLLMPLVHLEGSESRVQTELITTTHRTSKGGVALVKGQVDSYATTTVSGLAKLMVT